MVELYFSDNYEHDTLIATCKENQIMKYIQDFIDECNKDRYYKFIMTPFYRAWKDSKNNKKTWIDVGSHSEFFYTIEVTNE